MDEVEKLDYQGTDQLLLNPLTSSIDSSNSTESEINVHVDDLGRVIIPDYDTIDCMSNNELVTYLETLNYGSDPSLKTEFDMRTRLKLERVRWKNLINNQTRHDLYANSMHEENAVQRAEINAELTHCCEMATKIKSNQYFSNANQKDKFVEHLDRKINNFEENFEQLNDMFNKEYYPILVTGEVSSGKSTFINLLLNEDLLPTAYTAISSTLCEIRHVKFANQVDTLAQRNFVFHPNLECEVSHFSLPNILTRIAYVHPLKSKQPIIIVKDSDTFVDDLSNYLGNINDRINVRYKKIELFVLNKRLETGLCIVDSPGFSENDMFNQMLREYFKNALAFIYIIKTTAAGGIQENGLERVIHEIREICHDGQYGHRWDSAIFVFNMWDEVKSNKKEILKHLKEKLYSNWHSLKESQIFTLSSKCARYLQKCNFVAEDLEPILDRVQYLLETAIFNQYTLIYRAMMQFVRVSIQLSDSFLYQIKVEQNELEERYKSIFSGLDKLQKNADLIIESMHQSLTDSAKEGLENLCNHLKMPDTQQRIIDKMVNLEPPVGLQWWQIEAQLRIKVAKVIKEELCKFECQSPFFDRLRKSTFQRFRDAFINLEKKVNALERNLAGYDSQNFEAVDMTLTSERLQERMIENKFWQKVGSFNTSEMIAFGVSMPLLLPLAIAAGMIALPVIGVYTVKERLLHIYRRRQMERYNSSDVEKVKLIKEVTRQLIVRYQKNSSELKAYVHFEMGIIYDILKQLKLAVTKQFQDDKDQIRDLMNERRDKEVIRKFYEPLRETFKWKRRRLFCLKTFYLFSNMMDLPMDFLEKGDKVLCHGLIADLFQGHVRTNPMVELEKMDVTIRRLSYQVDANNIEKYLKEEEFYKFHNNKHILTAKAVAKKPTLTALAQQLSCNNPCDHLLLLCEPISHSLRYHLEQKIFNKTVPQMRCDLRFVYLSSIVKQILNGLMFLHSRSCTHYDLTLDTLAVIDNNSVVIVKLTNIRRCVYFKEIAQLMCTSESSDVRKIAHLDYEIINHVRFLLDEAVASRVDQTEESPELDHSKVTLKINSCPQKIKYVNRMEYTSKHDMYSLAMLMYEAWTGTRIEDEWYKYWTSIDTNRTSLTSNSRNCCSLKASKKCSQNDVTNSFYDVTADITKSNKCSSFNETTNCLSIKSIEQTQHQEWLKLLITDAEYKDQTNCLAENVNNSVHDDDELEKISKSFSFNWNNIIQHSDAWLKLVQSCWTHESGRFNCEMLNEKLDLC